jgi:hypothetical protein
MPRAIAKRRRTIIAILSLPAAATTALCAASFTWHFLWAPPATPAGQPADRCAWIWCGSFHYTNKAVEWGWRSANPSIEMKPIIGYAPPHELTWPGITARQAPVPLRSAQWQTYYRPGNLKFPLLPAAALLLVAPAAYWTLTRPRAPGHCVRCNYNLQGLGQTAACPECGASVSQ